MASLKLLVALIVMAMLVNITLCTNYTVGAPKGSWDMTTSLQAWSSSHTFNPGDALTFQYSAIHDVVEVTKADYDACQVTNPISSYTDGSTVIALNAIGKRYFICGVPGHCNLGMKVEIETVAPGDRPHPFALPPAEVPELPPPGSPVAAVYPGYRSTGAGTLGSSSGSLPPPAISSSSTMKSNALLRWAAMLVLALQLWRGF